MALLRTLAAAAAALLVPAALAAAAAAPAEPNPPQWPKTVKVFGPESPDVNATVHAVYEAQYSDLYTSGRAALLFKPGVYNVDVPVGYYTTVHGLGCDCLRAVFQNVQWVPVAVPEFACFATRTPPRCVPDVSHSHFH